MKTKKIIPMTGVLMFICLVGHAQVFQKGSKIIHAGLGIGSAYQGAGLSTDVPPLSASFEYGITDKIGVGGMIGYYAGSASSTFKTLDYQGNIVDGTITNSVSALVIGVRGTYHFLTTDKYDIYGSGMLAYDAADASVTIDPSSAAQYTPMPTATASGPVIGAVGGARYFFTKNIGAYAEVGYSIAFLNMGLSVKF